MTTPSSSTWPFAWTNLSIVVGLRPGHVIKVSYFASSSANVPGSEDHPSDEPVELEVGSSDADAVWVVSVELVVVCDLVSGRRV